MKTGWIASFVTDRRTDFLPQMELTMVDLLKVDLARAWFHLWLRLTRSQVSDDLLV